MVSVVVDKCLDDPNSNYKVNVKMSKTTLYEVSSEVTKACNGLLENYYNLMVQLEQNGTINESDADDYFQAVINYINDSQDEMKKKVRNEHKTISNKKISTTIRLD